MDQKTDIFITFCICSLQSRMLSLPSSSFLAISFCLSGFCVARSCMCSINPCMSPRPSNLEMKGWGENRSRSCRCSPTPRNIIGVFVAATLQRAQYTGTCGRKRYHIIIYIRGYCSTTLGMAVHFRNDNRAKVRTLLESATLGFCSLT